MKRSIAITFLLLAWLCANGAVWDVVQVIAWSRMFVGYAQSLPAGEALQRTLDPKKPCALCKVVRKAREAQPREPQSTPKPGARDEELLIAAESTPEIVFSPSTPTWSWTSGWVAAARTEPVPLRPPRA